MARPYALVGFLSNTLGVDIIVTGFKRLDAFPSGHAVHIGALASAATGLPPAQRNAVWAVGGAVVLTRIVLLAHWISDVVAGLAVGAAVERLLRFVIGFERR